jgi:hypothetical protein
MAAGTGTLKAPSARSKTTPRNRALLVARSGRTAQCHLVDSAASDLSTRQCRKQSCVDPHLALTPPLPMPMQSRGNLCVHLFRSRRCCGVKGIVAVRIGRFGHDMHARLARAREAEMHSADLPRALQSPWPGAAEQSMPGAYVALAVDHPLPYFLRTNYLSSTND